MSALVEVSRIATRRAGNPVYDWDEILDGTDRTLTVGVEIREGTLPRSFAKTAYSAAKARQIMVSIRLRDDGVDIRAGVKSRGGRPPMRRPFALEPLRALFPADLSWTQLALQLGVTAHLLHWLRDVGLTVDQADEMATAAGLHPCEVWGDDWWMAAG